ncbi:MAG: exosome complex RNA-binding protein Rrp4 [Thaumarchaeota archaeon]|nr:exosome complex RNA-binding protein Rrp4 [Nitrososphaerota archaeon]
MPEIVRKQVIPGDVIVSGDYRPGSFVERRGDDLIALRIGLAEIVRSDVKVIPLSGSYIPRVEDLVVGKVSNMTGYGWEIDIGSCFLGYLPAQFVFGRDFSPATHDLSSRFRVGDMLLAKIEAYDRSRDPQLSIRGPGFGLIPHGELVRISPTKVPRLIGKKGYMIKMIGNLTHCDIRVGQNGLVVLDGPPEGVVKAVQAVHLIEQEAHMADLTQKVEAFLTQSNQTGQPSQATPPSAPNSGE